jgi:hypothetical protein
MILLRLILDKSTIDKIKNKMLLLFVVCLFGATGLGVGMMREEQFNTIPLVFVYGLAGAYGLLGGLYASSKRLVLFGSSLLLLSLALFLMQTLRAVYFLLSCLGIIPLLPLFFYERRTRTQTFD